MQISIKLLLLCLTLLLSQNSLAYQELPFCPGGGPPGWMNYFDYKRNQNIWRHQHRMDSYYPSQPYSYQYRQAPARPSYNTKTRPPANTTRNQPYSQSRPSYNNRRYGQRY